MTLTASLALSAPIPWLSRRRRFAANVQALAPRVPGAAAWEDLWEAAAGRYELRQSSDGSYQVRDAAAGPAQAWLGGLSAHREESGHWTFPANSGKIIAPIAFDGAGFGYLLVQVLQSTYRSFLSYSCPVYVAEPDAVAVCILLHLHDLREHAGRLRLFVGSGALEDLAQALRTHAEWSLPAIFFCNRLTYRAPLGLEAAVAAVRGERERRRAELQGEIQAYYADKTPAYWRRRFAEAGTAGPPLRVLGITTRFSTVLQHSMAELAAAVRAAGHEMQVAIEPDDQSTEPQEIPLLATLRPDLVVLISRMAHENPAIPRQVPTLCWDQDNLPCMRTAEATAAVQSALNYVAGHGALLGYRDLAWPRRNCIFVHAAGQTHRYSVEPVGADMRRRYACDFSYISNASASPEELARANESAWQATPEILDLYRGLVGQILAEAEAGQTSSLDGLQERVRVAAAERKPAVPPHLLRELHLVLGRISDRAFRHAALRWVARWCRGNGRSLKIYGAGWEKAAAWVEFAAGPAAQGEEVRAIYQASQINLQIIETGVLHSRVLDGLAAGGFFLTRGTPIDGDEVPEIRDVYALAAWVKANGIQSERELEARATPEVRRQLAATRRYYAAQKATVDLIWAFQSAAVLPPAALVFPHFAEIRFRTEEEFAARAARFLADDSLRQAIARDMHETVRQHFSYDTRWQQFLSAITAGLADR